MLTTRDILLEYQVYQAMRHVRPQELKDGDIVLSQDMLGEHPPEHVEQLLRKLGELGFDPARFERESTRPVDLLPYDPETQPALGSQPWTSLREFLEQQEGISKMVHNHAESLLVGIQKRIREGDAFTEDVIEETGRAPVMYAGTRSKPYQGDYRPSRILDNEGLMIDMDVLECHMRPENLTRRYYGIGDRSISAVRAFVNARILEVSGGPAPSTESP